MFPLWMCGWLGCSSVGPVDPYTQSNSRYAGLFVIADGSRHLVSFITSTPDEHLVTVDARTGERLVAQALTCDTPQKQPELYPPVGTQAWVRCGNAEAYVVDLKTGAIVRSHEQIVAGHPDLTAGFRIQTHHIDNTVDPPTRALPLKLHDGRSAWLGMNGQHTFAPDPKQRAWIPGYFCWPEHKCSRARKECLGFQQSDSGVGMVLSTNRVHGERKSAARMAPVGDWPVGLLMPGLVGEPDTRCAYEREEHHLILHDSAAFAPKQTLMSKVSRSGTIAWSVPYETLGATDRHQPRRAVMAGDQILILVGNTRNRAYVRAIYVDDATGAVISAVDLFGNAPELATP